MAVLRIKGAGSLPFAKLGDSDGMEMGDWVLAIGNPFEQEHSVSAGIISGKGRELNSINRAKFLQTDAAINPGNSGGPLVNLEGEVIGINTAIATNTGAYNGIGFAVPSNTAKWVVEQLLHDGSVKRAYLGVKIGPIDHALGSGFNVGPGDGVLIAEVYADTPAAQAKIEDGDIVRSFDGVKVHSPRDLQELVERAPLGSKHKLEVLRDGKTLDLSITAQAMPEKFGLVSKVDSSEGAASDGSSYEAKELGLSVVEATEKNLSSLGFKGFSGVLINSVESGSVAEEGGLKNGMLIMKVGSHKVKSVEEFKEALAKESLEKGVVIQVRGAGGNNFVVLKK
jgi:serine protease Do